MELKQLYDANNQPFYPKVGGGDNQPYSYGMINFMHLSDGTINGIKSNHEQAVECLTKYPCIIGNDSFQSTDYTYKDDNTGRSKIILVRLPNSSNDNGTNIEFSLSKFVG